MLIFAAVVCSADQQLRAVYLITLPSRTNVMRPHKAVGTPVASDAWVLHTPVLRVGLFRSAFEFGRRSKRLSNGTRKCQICARSKMSGIPPAIEGLHPQLRGLGLALEHANSLLHSKTHLRALDSSQESSLGFAAPGGHRRKRTFP
jgi:hypothetical protein